MSTSDPLWPQPTAPTYDLLCMDDFCSRTVEHLTIRGCGWWTSMANFVPTDAESKTVVIPATQRIDMSGLAGAPPDGCHRGFDQQSTRTIPWRVERHGAFTISPATGSLP
ncbi:MAG: hypothetical protein OXC25_07545 [Thiotrichales bacterium]|nr:hypothetical protein [Thiotrichales bacterium]